jgi:hypothetical protein
MKFKDILKGQFLHEKLGDIFELFEDIIIVLLLLPNRRRVDTS